MVCAYLSAYAAGDEENNDMNEFVMSTSCI